MAQFGQYQAADRAHDARTTGMIGAGGRAWRDQIGVPAEHGIRARFPGRDHFAAYNGTAPAEVSSGNRKVHRLSLRGIEDCQRAMEKLAAEMGEPD